MEFERQILEENDGLKARGVAILLRNINTGRYYTAIEKDSKEDLRRKPGSVSIISETAKVGEDLLDNILGALGEYPLLKGDKLHFCENSYLGVFRFANVGESHVFLVDIDTTTQSFEGAKALSSDSRDNSEVTPNRWMEYAEMIEDTNLRYGMRELLEWARNQQNFDYFLNRNLNNDEIIQDKVMVENHVRDREELPDARGKFYNSAD